MWMKREIKRGRAFLSSLKVLLKAFSPFKNCRERERERVRELIRRVFMTVNFKIQFKINEWPKNSEILDLRSFLNVLSRKNIKPTNYILVKSSIGH
jgi:hypothetical protein